MGGEEEGVAAWAAAVESGGRGGARTARGAGCPIEKAAAPQPPNTLSLLARERRRRTGWEQIREGELGAKEELERKGVNQIIPEKARPRLEPGRPGARERSTAAARPGRARSALTFAAAFPFPFSFNTEKAPAAAAHASATRGSRSQPRREEGREEAAQREDDRLGTFLRCSWRTPRPSARFFSFNFFPGPVPPLSFSSPPLIVPPSPVSP